MALRVFISLCVLICLGSVSGAALAYELKWSNGLPDMSAHPAQLCTLYVRTSSSEETLPPGWILSWIAESDSGAAFEFVSDPGVDAARTIQSIVGPTTSIEALTHTQMSTEHFDDTAPASHLLGVVLRVLSANANIRLRLGANGGGAAQESGTHSDATINGGVPKEPPPLITDCSLHLGTRQTLVTLKGIDLANTTKIALSDDAHSAEIPVVVDPLVRSGTIGWALGMLGQPATKVLVTAATGMIGEATVSSADTLDADAFGLDEITIRFRPGVIPATAETPSLEELAVTAPTLATALTSSGVVSMTRAFPNISPGDRYSTNLIGEPIVLDDLSDVYIAKLLPQIEATDAVSSLRAQPQVYYVHPHPLVYAAAAIPNDSLYSIQWILHNTGQNMCGHVGTPGVDIGIPSAWDLSFGASSESVAVLDTGLDTRHVEFTNHYGLGPSFAGGDSQDLTEVPAYKHGTACAGIIGALTNNSHGIAGVAGNVVPFAVRVMSGEGFMTSKALRNGIAWTTARKLPIVSLSLAADCSFFTECQFPPSGTAVSLSSLNDVCLNAFHSGQMIVAAMGNNDAHVLNYPAALSKRVVGVGATFLTGKRWTDQAIYSLDSLSISGGSVYGEWCDFSAPGGEFVFAPRVGPYGYYNLSSCAYDKSYTYFGGTSGATPVVAGTAALLRSIQPRLLGEDIYRILAHTALDIPPAGMDDSTGNGLIRADAAVQYLAPTTKAFIQGSVGYAGNSGALAILDSANVVRTFLNVPGLPSALSNVSCVRYILQGSAAFDAGFSGSPDAWARSSGSRGWPDTTTFDYSYEVYQGRVVPGTITSAGCALTTQVFRIPSYGWYPCPPDSARVAFSALGTSALVGVVTPGIGDGVSLLRASPNPSRGPVALSFSAEPGNVVDVTIYDVRGRVVRRAFRGMGRSEITRIEWDRRDWRGQWTAPGVYFAVLSRGGANKLRTAIIVH